MRHYVSTLSLTMASTMALTGCFDGEEDLSEAAIDLGDEVFEEAPPSLHTPNYHQLADELEEQDGVKRALVSTAAGSTLMPYEIIDGEAVAEGDLVLGAPEQVADARERGVALTDTWYPDGDISWRTSGLSLSQRTTIRNVMDAYEERTPLRLSAGGTNADLTFKRSIWEGRGGAWTYGYWDTNEPYKEIAYFSDASVNSSTTAHEFGHALGFPHEFQRPDSPYENFCFPSDPWNMAKLDTAAVSVLFGAYRYLSPYDEESVMQYRNGCVLNAGVTPPAVPPVPRHSGREALLSRHDINSIYRTYGTALGSSRSGEQFGHETEVADFDGDGFEDIVVGTNELTGTTRSLKLYAYRGVATADGESDAGRKYMPWFSTTVETGIANNDQGKLVRLSLAAGDFNGDDHADLAVGFVGTQGGRVHMYRQAETAVAGNEFGAPWGVKGFELVQEFRATDFGLDYYSPGIFQPGVKHGFGASLHAARLTTTGRDDLIIGAPAAYEVRSGSSRLGSFQYAHTLGGAVIHVTGTNRWSDDLLDAGQHQVTWNPSSDRNADFGASLSARSEVCFGREGMIVGAPGEADDKGAVHVFDCSRVGSAIVSPALVDSLYSSQDGSRYGHAIASFRAVYNTGSGDVSKNFLAITAPQRMRSGWRVGYNYLYRLDGGVATHLRSLRAGGGTAGMEWGHSMAVIQEGDRAEDVRIAIGAPGATSSGVNAGYVFVWKALTSTGGTTTSGHFLRPAAADRNPNTRYGHSLSGIRYDDKGGFAIGAPGPDGDNFTAGFLNARINRLGVDSASWSSYTQYLNQETTGDLRPDNR